MTDQANTSETTTESDGLRIELTGDVMRLTMNRGESRNPQSPSFWARMREARDLAERTNPKVILLAGEGKSFSVGMDKRMFTPEGIPGEGSLMELGPAGDDTIHERIGEIQDSFSWLVETPAIVLAAVQGHTVGAGFQLALSADIVVCGHDAQFCMKEAAYGLIPDLTGTSPLVRAVGYQRALEICVTARWVNADEAVRLGLAIDSVPSDKLLDRAQEVVDAVTNEIPGVAAELKALLKQGHTNEPREQFQSEREAQIRRLKSLAELMAATQQN